ncbi:hypothetical protein CONPUDRAFT_169926 [Coniophora puteana RWD-64-598 SS2]|uniref:Family A G protein-coupled receptor-like protein n=1 Tax=Coniophora puteana (strain RWD-64-598) TaxID=741705 RepID=R7SHK1_CONPW|nr:uncharacterized protein CONPUDRAFT_169926 [Coniophora puteana RWD-64-598 SS2]EIW74549.1 hypothetical protein CONPUDRAFT_169926 [Coniophora puteana RWD-64-598 SS2]
MSSSPSSFDPTSGIPPETQDALYLDSIRLVGATTIAGAFYGISTATAFLCLGTLVRTRSRFSTTRYAFFLCYVVMVWLCGTVFVAGQACEVQEAYVTHRTFAEGPFVWGNKHQLRSLRVLVNVTYWVLVTLSDGLVVWRLKVIFSTSRWVRYLISLPVLLYLGMVVTGLISWLSNTVPDQRILPAHSLASNIPPLVLTIAFNVISTTLMAGRLWRFRRRSRKILNPALHPNHFTNIAHILIESCALLTATSLVYMALSLVNHPGVYIMVTLLPQVQIIAPLLVLLRISQGIAWGATGEELSVSRSIVDLERVRARLEQGSSDRGEESAEG